ncbi:hypothetical protein M3589_17025 [Heyndrickxia oleronia]|uniref:hypothetical protein n=1 Tax=Heyndrickxia oleronia TaxID=38875 RepID=UPI00203BF381|nr:hypothetical protein [Heyndrickxia oleronia]MCM3239406.1 hypothetical protein [Heyndrickxia oleronia]
MSIHKNGEDFHLNYRSFSKRRDGCEDPLILIVLKGAGFQFVKEGTFAHYNNDYEQAMLILKKVIKI